MIAHESIRLALSESIMHMDQDQWILAARSEDFKECISAFVENAPQGPQAINGH